MLKRKNRKTSKHHVIPKSDGGKGLPYNKMRLPNKVHDKVHELDRKVDRALVKKDEYYYLMIIRAAYKCK